MPKYAIPIWLRLFANKFPMHGRLSVKALLIEAIEVRSLMISKEISTLGDMNFFQDGEEVLTILQPLTLSVLYADEIFYYVSYFEDIFGVKKDEVEASEKEPLEEEASFVSVISFAEEKSDCKSNSCITVEKEKEFLKVLSDYS